MNRKEYVSRRLKKQSAWGTVANAFCVFIAGVMAGYAWAWYHFH